MSPAQDYALNATKIHFGGQSLHVCLNKYKQSWNFILV